MKTETDIELNPAILFDKEVSSLDLKLCGISLGDSCEKIKLKKVTGTSLIKFPGKTDSYKERDNKTFVVVDGKETEFTLSERIDALLKSEGYLHFESGFCYGVKNQIVVQFLIHDDALKLFPSIREPDIEKLFGKPDEISEGFVDYELSGYAFPEAFIYHQKQMRIRWSDSEQKIEAIYIGTDVPIDRGLIKMYLSSK